MNIKCPITTRIFNKPVGASDGFFYEKQAIERWQVGHKSSPLTREKLCPILYKCSDLKNYIEDYLNKNPQKRIKQYIPLISVDYIDNIGIIHRYIKSDQIEKLLKYTNYKLQLMDMGGLFNKCNDFIILKYVIDNAIDLECEDKYKRRPIHHACDNNHLKMVKYLIEKNVDLECKNDIKDRPIHIACENNYLDIFKCLVDQGVDLECKNEDRLRPLCFAIHNENVEMVKYLVDKNINLEYEDTVNMRPIHYACYSNNIDIVKCLIEKNVDLEYEFKCEPDQKNERPIHIACYKNNLDMVKCLVDIGVNLETENSPEKWRPIHFACHHNNLDMIKYLIDNNVDFESESSGKQKPMDLLCENKQAVVTKYIAEKALNSKVPTNIILEDK